MRLRQMVTLQGNFVRDVADSIATHPAVEAMFNPDPKRYEQLFMASIIVFVAVLLAETFEYNETSRQFPLIVGIPTFILASLLLLVLTSARFNRLAGRTLDKFEGKNYFTAGQSKEIPLEEQRRNSVKTLLWILALFALILTVGFMRAIAPFLIVYYSLATEEGWLKNLVYTAIITAFVYVVFDWFLETPFYQGFLFG